MKYVKRSSEGIMVLDRKAHFYTRGIRQFINDLCIKNLSTFEGREKAASSVLSIKSNLPIYVNEEMLLFPTKSIRNFDCIYVNYHKVLTVKKKSEGLSKVIFDDLSELVVDVNLTKLKRQYKRATTIYDYKNYN